MTNASSEAQNTGSLATLRQFTRRRDMVERCEMCSRELAPDHQHLIEPEQRRLLCACDACALLFTTQAGAKLRRVPRRARFLTNFRISDPQWNSLMIPIELAFLFYSSPHERVVAFYPSPAGATESLLPLETWSDIVEDNPVLAELTPDVEALLVNRVGSAGGTNAEYYIAPIDECYKLVGLIRIHWHGLSGGTEMWREIAKFFAALKDKTEIAREIANA